MTNLHALAHITAPYLGWGLALLAAGVLLGACAALAFARRSRR